MHSLENKVVLITGGSRGIGEGLVRNFAAAGATVAFTYLSSEEKAQKIVSELEKEGCKVKAYQSDACRFADAKDLVKHVIADFGNIHVLINNAGITRDTLMLRMDETQWDKVMENNLKSVFNMTKQVLRPMLRNRGGSIINMSSVVGVFGNAGQANYAASKAGIIGFTKSIAKEVGSRNIRCNAIAPGFIETEMTGDLDDKTRDLYLTNVPLKRFGTVDDVSEAALFLASDASTYITGQVIHVTGGMYM